MKSLPSNSDDQLSHYTSDTGKNAVVVVGRDIILWSSTTIQAKEGEGTTPVSEKAVRLEKFLFT